MNDVLGHAIFDFHCNAQGRAKLWIHNTYGPKEEMPVETYFRSEADMPKLELTAINACKGKILDVGAGAGSHAHLLQLKGADVTAMDISPKAAEVMKLRGVKNVIAEDIFLYSEKKFNTVLLLMNGIGLVGTIDGLRLFLQHAKNLLLPGGQLLFDSSDIAYLYESNIPKGKYYGEVLYAYHYKHIKSGWFSWLYIDKKTLTKIAVEEGWEMQVLFEDGFDQYLAKLSIL